VRASVRRGGSCTSARATPLLEHMNPYRDRRLSEHDGQPRKPKATRLRDDSNSGRLRGRGTMTPSTGNSPIYFQVLKGWMATHQGRMPGVPPTAGEPEDYPVGDTPDMDDRAPDTLRPTDRYFIGL
jgi:hypothetical protein